MLPDEDGDVCSQPTAANLRVGRTEVHGLVPGTDILPTCRKDQCFHVHVYTMISKVLLHLSLKLEQCAH